MSEYELQIDTIKNRDYFGKPEKIVVYIDQANGKDKTACIATAFDAVGKAAILAAKSFSKAVSAVQAYTETLLSVYPNKRVLHLAKYHQKEHVRKKNMRRVLKYLESEVSEWPITNPLKI